MKIYSFFLNNSWLYVLHVIVLLFLCWGCISTPTKAMNDYYQNKLSFNRLGTPEYVQFYDHKIPNRMYCYIPLANTVEIKLFIYAQQIQTEIDNGINYHTREYRYIWEPDFDFIAEILRKKYLGINLVHGRQSFVVPTQGNQNVVARKIEDGLDYSYSYVHKHGVVSMQIGEVYLSDDGQEIKMVYILSYPDGTSGSVYCFRKKGEFWFFHFCEKSWISS